MAVALKEDTFASFPEFGGTLLTPTRATDLVQFSLNFSVSPSNHAESSELWRAAATCRSATGPHDMAGGDADPQAQTCRACLNYIQKHLDFVKPTKNWSHEAQRTASATGCEVAALPNEQRHWSNPQVKAALARLLERERARRAGGGAPQTQVPLRGSGVHYPLAGAAQRSQLAEALDGRRARRGRGVGGAGEAVPN